MTSRDWRVDFWRGLAVLMIFVNHIPDNIATAFTSRNFGISDAAELFVFLSGYSCALLFVKRFSAGRSVSIFYTLGRGLQLYVYHIGMFCALAAIAATYTDITGADELTQALFFEPFFADTHAVITRVLTLTYQPPFLDILPLYIALTLSIGALFAIFGRAWWGYLVLSLALYIWARHGGYNLPSYPPGQTWFFNPLTWQLLFTLGFVFALARDEAWLQKLCASSVVQGLAVVILIIGFFAAAPWSYQSLISDWRPLDAIMWPLNDKQNASPLRIIHFLAAALIFSRLGNKAAAPADSIFVRGVCLVGRQALALFIVGTLLSQVVRGLLKIIGSSALAEMSVTIAGLAILMGLGYLLCRMDRRLLTAISRPIEAPSPRA